MKPGYLIMYIVLLFRLMEPTLGLKDNLLDLLYTVISDNPYIQGHASSID